VLDSLKDWKGKLEGETDTDGDAPNVDDPPSATKPERASKTFSRAVLYDEDDD
jgi:hypothetical protein